MQSVSRKRQNCRARREALRVIASWRGIFGAPLVLSSAANSGYQPSPKQIRRDDGLFRFPRRSTWPIGEFESHQRSRVVSDLSVALDYDNGKESRFEQLLAMYQLRGRLE
jgi:hypothetical protein